MSFFLCLSLCADLLFSLALSFFRSFCGSFVVSFVNSFKFLLHCFLSFVLSFLLSVVLSFGVSVFRSGRDVQIRACRPWRWLRRTPFAKHVMWLTCRVARWASQQHHLAKQPTICQERRNRREKGSSGCHDLQGFKNYSIIYFVCSFFL